MAEWGRKPPARYCVSWMCRQLAKSFAYANACHVMYRKCVLLFFVFSLSVCLFLSFSYSCPMSIAFICSANACLSCQHMCLDGRMVWHMSANKRHERITNQHCKAAIIPILSQYFEWAFEEFHEHSFTINDEFCSRLTLVSLRYADHNTIHCNFLV